VSASSARRGALLVVVAGLTALMAALALAFLARVRADTADSYRLGQDIQARVMLGAALMYVQETSRIGWDEETFGWRDVRDGTAGPRGFDGSWPARLAPLVLRQDGSSAVGAPYPAVGGRASRHAMYAMRRPPFAIASDLAPNPVPIASPADSASFGLSWAQIIGFNRPWPQPVVNDPDLFRDGDRAPLNQAAIPSWFRVHRSGIATFVITCGAGATRGYRDWAEVQGDGAEDVFGSRALFLQFRGEESLLWYEAEWSDHVTGNAHLHGHYGRWNQRDIGSIGLTSAEAPNRRQFAGTFVWIARLPGEPDTW